jgi:hypothetical protein
MNRIRTIGRRITLLTGLAIALLVATGAVPAFAVQAPPAAGGGVFVPTSSPSPPVYVGGMPGWQIALIAVGAAIAAATVAVIADRARHAHWPAT